MQLQVRSYCAGTIGSRRARFACKCGELACSGCLTVRQNDPTPFEATRRRRVRPMYSHAVTPNVGEASEETRRNGQLAARRR